METAKAIVDALLEADDLDPKRFAMDRPQMMPAYGDREIADAITRAATCMKLWFRQDYKHYLSDKEFLADLGSAVNDVAAVEFVNIGHEDMRNLEKIADEYLENYFRGKRLADYQKAHMKVWREIAAGLVTKLLHHRPAPPLQ
jgi:hypothetical protein